VTPNRLCGHPESEADCDRELVFFSYALHDLGATERENGRRGAAHAERASEGASDGKLVPGEFRPRRQVDCFFSTLFRQSGWQPFRAEVGLRGPRGVHSGNRDQHRPPCQRAPMSDKSPRQTMTKKSGKSLKEKRAAKRTKAAQISQTEALLHTKKR
jgi:hypothetical protein